MGRTILCPLENLSVTNDADQDIWRLNAGASNKLRLLGFELYSAAIAAENLRLQLLRRSADGTGGTGGTEVLADEDDGSITAALTTLVTTPGTAGAILWGFQWEQLGPLIWIPPPSMQIIVDASGRIALNLLTALAGTTAMSGVVAWEEI